MLVYENGLLLPRGILLENPFESGYTTGHGLFETIFVNRGNPMFLREHYDRMQNGLGRVKLPNLPEYELIERWCYEYLRHLSGEGFASKFSGKLRMNWVKSGVGKADLHLYGEAFSYPMEWYRKGIQSGFAKLPFVTGNSLDNLKTLGYAENIIEKTYGAEMGYQECLRLNKNDEICEGAISNVFWITGSTLYTSDLKLGILPGILRAWVLRKAKERGINTVELQIGRAAINRADGIFYTNSLMGLMPVSEFEGKGIGTLGNRIFLELRDEYQTLLGK